MTKFLVWKEIRTVWLPLLDGEKSLVICLAVSTRYRRVTDKRTDRQTSCDSIVRAMHTHRHRAVKMVRKCWGTTSFFRPRGFNIPGATGPRSHPVPRFRLHAFEPLPLLHCCYTDSKSHQLATPSAFPYSYCISAPQSSGCAAP